MKINQDMEINRGKDSQHSTHYIVKSLAEGGNVNYI